MSLSPKTVLNKIKTENKYWVRKETTQSLVATLAANFSKQEVEDFFRIFKREVEEDINNSFLPKEAKPRYIKENLDAYEMAVDVYFPAVILTPREPFMSTEDKEAKLNGWNNAEERRQALSTYKPHTEEQGVLRKEADHQARLFAEVERKLYNEHDPIKKKEIFEQYKKEAGI